MCPIRVGLIRCDTHGMYYATLMDKHDAVLLANPLRNGGTGRYSWQGGGLHFYFYTNYCDRTRIAIPTVDGFRIDKVWDEYPDAAENLSLVLHGKPMVCETFEEASEDVDLVFIADCNGDGSDHLKLAIPSLTKGIPTFVDKPFACELEDALAMVQMAERYKTPLMSLSILREVPQFTLFKSRFAEIGGSEFGIIKGGGPTLAGQVHAISLAQHLFGSGVESVECMGQTSLAYIHLDYGEKEGRPSKGVVLNCDSGGTYHAAFYASVYSQQGAIHSPGIGDFEFPYGAANILQKVKQMVEARQSSVPYDEMVENIAVVTAARLAQKANGRVCIRDVIGK